MNHFREPSPQEKDRPQESLFEVESGDEALFETYNYEILDKPELRYEYVRYTEGLIAKTIAEKQDTLIFLDKSARPVAWLMRSLWPTLGVEGFDEDGEPIPAKMPDMKFVNIDREQWAASMGRSEVAGGAITLDGVHPDTIDSLTGLFAVKNFDKFEDVPADEPTMFDDKKILIVDEVKSSGDTLTMSEMLFKKAFKNAKSITGTYWMTPEVKYDKKTGGSVNADLPVWYDKNQITGRLVGNRDGNRSVSSPSIRQRRGAQFLSYPFRDDWGNYLPDKRGIKLRREMYQLGKDVANGVMPVIYDAAERPDDDHFVDSFMERVNGLSTHEFGTLLRTAKSEHKPFPQVVLEYKRARALSQK